MKRARPIRFGKRRPALGLFLAATMLGVGAAVTSCAAQPNAVPTKVVPTGHVTGVVQIRGGVIRPTAAEARVTATPVEGAAGTSYNSDTAGDGSFSFDLPVGTYELSAVLTKRNIGDHATPQTVTVTAGVSTTASLYVNYP